MHSQQTRNAITIHSSWRRIGNIFNGFGDIGIKTAPTTVHSLWRRIGNIIDGVGDIGIDAAPTTVHSLWRHIGNFVNGVGDRQHWWREWRLSLYQIDYFVGDTMKGVPVIHICCVVFMLRHSTVKRPQPTKEPRNHTHTHKRTENKKHFVSCRGLP